MHWCTAVVIGALFSIGCVGTILAAPITRIFPPDTIVPASDQGVNVLRVLLKKPENQIDLAKAKVIIDRIIDPNMDEAVTLKQVDVWVDKVRERIPAGSSSWTKLLVLVSTLYQPGPWNDWNRFDYDFNDPFSKDIHTSQLAHYLSSRRGNCVSMPIFLAILAQRIGLQVTLATAPNHIFVNLKNDDGTWVNVEATSGSSPSNEYYQGLFQITQKAMATGIYMRPLSRHESVVAMMATLLVYYRDHRGPTQQMALSNLALEIDQKNVVALIARAGAYDSQVTELYRKRYPDPSLIPADKRQDYQMLMRNYFEIANRLVSLGWHKRTPEQDAGYLQKIQQAKAAQKGR